MGVCNCSMFCCTFLYVQSSFAIILMGKTELVALLSLSSWCLVMVVWLFLPGPCVCLRFVIVVFPDHTHLLFLVYLRLVTFNWRRGDLGLKTNSSLQKQIVALYLFSLKPKVSTETV